MNRPLAFGLALVLVALAWPVLMLPAALARGWRIVKVRLVDEDELRKAGL